MFCNEKLVAVITGGSSGIGKATAQYLSEKGFIVYEFSRSGQDTKFVAHITCDVTKEESVAAAVKETVDKAKKIDLLINNAGFGISGAIEDTEIIDAKKQFDVNFFGMAMVTKYALPYLRESKGQIINLSSVAGILSIPFQCFYSASKAAINSYSLALKNEVRPFKVRVSAIMPGDIKTSFTQNREKESKQSVYTKRVESSVKCMEKDETNGMSPQFIAKNIYKLTKKKNPKVIYTAGIKYKLFSFLSKILPERLISYIIYQMYAK